MRAVFVLYCVVLFIVSFLALQYREMVALRCLYFDCYCSVALLRVHTLGLQCVIVVLPDHTH